MSPHTFLRIVVVCIGCGSYGVGFAAKVPAADGARAEAYAQGYADALLQQDLHWRPGSYRLEIESGMAYVTSPRDWAGSVEQIRNVLHRVSGIRSVKVLASSGEEPTPDAGRPLLSDGTFFPKGDLFRPLIADPKEPSFFTSYRLYHTSAGTYHLGAVGYGGTLGLYRWRHGPAGGELQLDFAAGAFSQFNLGVASPQLINTDFTVGIPLTWRRGANSMRVTLFHQSSHLGPRFFADYQPTDYQLSYEALSALWSHSWGGWRAYGGGAFLLWPHPTSFKRPMLQGGLEFRGQRILWGFARLVAGLDVKSWEQTDWEPDVSLKFGLQYAGMNPAQRILRVLFEGYSGHLPHGQFYKFKGSYLGLGVYLQF